MTTKQKETPLPLRIERHDWELVLIALDGSKTTWHSTKKNAYRFNAINDAIHEAVNATGIYSWRTQSCKEIQEEQSNG